MDETLEIKDVVEQGEKKEGYIKDFISGISVRATPEEVESGFPALRRAVFCDTWSVRPSDTVTSVPLGLLTFPMSLNDDAFLYTTTRRPGTVASYRIAPCG